MATINYDLNNSLQFPPLSKPFHAKQGRKKSNRKRKDDDGVDETKSRINDLSDDLLELVFAKLSPWKHLAKLKCVLRRWNSIISNPDFTRRLPHESFPFTLFLRWGDHGNCKCLITEHPYFQKHKLRLDFIPTSHIVAKTTDLFVAIANTNSQFEYYIANPLTKQYVVVPIRLTEPVYENRHCIVGIAGFVNGVSTVNNTNDSYHDSNLGFRIVRIFFEDPKLVVQIYSSKTGQWKTYSFDYSFFYRWTFQNAVTWNNKIHWMNNHIILVIDPFNIDNVAPRVLKRALEIANSNSVLGVCQDRLQLILLDKNYYTYNTTYPRIKVWEVEDYSNDLATNYTAKVRLVVDFQLTKTILEKDLSQICRIFSTSNWYLGNSRTEIICCHPNDPQVVYFLYDGALYYCNVVRHRCKVMLAYCNITHLHDSFVFVHPP